MSYTVRIQPEAEADLERIWHRDSGSAAFIATALSELECDQDLLDRLNQHGHCHRGSGTRGLGVSRWQRLFPQGYDIYRVKFFELERRGRKYRIIHSFDPSTHTFDILAILPREDINYDDPSHPTTIRILDTYSRTRH